MWLLLTTLGCPKDAPPPAAQPAGPLVVDDAGDLASASGPGTVIGTLAAQDGGTVLTVSGGGAVWVSAGAPPDGWDWMLGTQVRVQGRLEAVDGKVWLRDPGPPLPAEMAPSL
jgi:hypothetical protein